MKEKFKMGIMITNIQRMCFHDGPGIRTTVFLKGCSIHCPWCANPENISFQKQNYTEASTQAVRQYGKEYGADELVRILTKDEKFWGSDGGVTFSGGEPLMHACNLLDVWKMLKVGKVHMAIETSLFVPEENVKVCMEYVDLFYVDVKLLDSEMCGRILGGKVETYLRNVQLLAERGKQIRFRIPCSEEYVLKPHNLGKIYAFLGKYPQYPVEIFAIHNLGDSKYRNLNMEPKYFQAVSEERLQEVKGEIEKLGINVEIIRL